MDILQQQVTSHGDRIGSKPILIVNHVSAGSMKSMGNTFANPVNQASSHYGVGRDGSIVQYVPLERAAWTQGRIQSPTSPIIKQLGGNPNRYCVSIESEGYMPTFGIDGSKTEEQFWSLCWLHKWIQVEVERIYGVHIPLNGERIIGHCMIDSIGKPLCPGPSFPWARLLSEMAFAEAMTLDEYAERINYMKNPVAGIVEAYSAFRRIKELWTNYNTEKWKAAAETKFMYLAAIAERDTPEKIKERIEDLYDKAQSGKWKGEAIRKLLLISAVMKEKGLL